MIVTVMQTFVDAPKGRQEKRYNLGDVVSISKPDYERIISQAPGALVEGKRNIGQGICHACTRNKNRKKNN